MPPRKKVDHREVQCDDIVELRDHVTTLHAGLNRTDQKVDTVIENQVQFQKDMKGYFDRLEVILTTNIETRKDTDALKENFAEYKKNQEKINDILFEKARDSHKAIDCLQKFKAIFENNGIYSKIEKLMAAYNSQVGVKKWKAEIYATILFVIALIGFFGDL